MAVRNLSRVKELYLAGYTLQYIGDEFRLTSERIRQLVVEKLNLTQGENKERTRNKALYYLKNGELVARNITKTCLRCNKEFSCHRTSPQRYCTRECITNDPEERVCLNCDEKYLYIPNRLAGIYFCSRNCYHEEKKRFRIFRRTRVCEYCKKEYVQSVYDPEQKYCSMNCAFRASNILFM